MNAIVIHLPNSPACSLSISNSMTLVSNDPSWWPVINADIISSYFVVAACAAIIYDWGLTFGQEVELIWVSGLLHQKNGVKVSQLFAVETTLVHNDPFVSRCTICCNRICCDERLDQCSNNFDNRCRVSEIFEQLIGSIQRHPQLPYHIRHTYLDG